MTEAQLACLCCIVSCTDAEFEHSNRSARCIEKRRQLVCKQQKHKNTALYNAHLRLKDSRTESFVFSCKNLRLNLIFTLKTFSSLPVNVSNVHASVPIPKLHRLRSLLCVYMCSVAQLQSLNYINIWYFPQTRCIQMDGDHSAASIVLSEYLFENKII